MTWKLYLHFNKLFDIELFWHLTVYKQNLHLKLTELAELELSERTELIEKEMLLTIKLCTHDKLNCLIICFKKWIFKIKVKESQEQQFNTKKCIQYYLFLRICWMDSILLCNINNYLFAHSYSLIQSISKNSS